MHWKTIMVTIAIQALVVAVWIRAGAPETWDGFTSRVAGVISNDASAAASAPGHAGGEGKVALPGDAPESGEYSASITAPAATDVHQVAFVVDGDTFYISGGAERIRLYGVDTPERGEACYSEATGALADLTRGGVRFEAGPRPVDGHGRPLYYAFTSDGRSVDLELVAQGYARAFRRDGQHRDVLVQAEQLARAAGTGCLWSH